MKIHIIRHGRTDWNVQMKIQGKTDIPLNEEGVLQARELAGELKKRKQELQVSRIYTSFLQRAKQTAEIVAEVLELPCEILPGVEEMDLGDWEGYSWTEVKEKWPEYYDAWHKERRYTKTLNGESYEDVLQRLLPALYRLSESASEDVIVVTHSAVIMALMSYLNNTPFEKMRMYDVKNTAVTTIDAKALKICMETENKKN